MHTALRTIARAAPCALTPVASARSAMMRMPCCVQPPTSCFSTAATSSTVASASSHHAAAVPPPPPRSFIELAKQQGSAALLGPFPTMGLFDVCLKGLHITRMDPSGEVEAWMTVDRVVENSWGTLHGGAIATLVDVLGTLALLAKDHKRGGVSVELSVSYLVAVKAGDKVMCKGRTLKLGKTLGFTEVQLFTHDGKLAATGRHTKAM